MMNLIITVFGYDHIGRWLGIGLCCVFLYALLRRPDPFYRDFKRVGGNLSNWLMWKPVYANVRRGYELYAKRLQRPFVVNWWAKDYIVLPQRYLAELRGADPKVLSFFQNIQDALWLTITAGDLYTAKSGDRMVEVVTRGINPRLPQIIPSLVEEINIAFEAELGTLSGQKEVVAFAFFGDVARRIAVRFLVGPELCRNEQFLKALDSFTMSIFGSALLITKIPLGFLRPIAAQILTIPHKRKLKSCCQHLVPIIEKRMQQNQETLESAEDTFNGLDFIMRYRGLSSDDQHRDTADNLAIEIMHNLWAASSAPGGMMAEVVYQLLSEPEYIPLLRIEASKAVSLFGWTETMLNNLEKQDSFIREVNRLYPTGAMGVARTVTGNDYKCADGLTFPIGTRIVFPIQAIQADSDNLPNAESFDGFRFVSNNGNDSVPRGNATTMGICNLAWGYGNHACPGRFFAIRACKIVLTKLLLEYEIGWKRAAKGKPSRWHIEGQFVPNMSQIVWLRKRV